MSEYPQIHSTPNLHTFSGARNVRIGQGEFNNVGRDLVKNFNTSVSNPHRTLWDAVAGIGASHNSSLQFDRGRCQPGTREQVLRLIREWRSSKSHNPPVCWLSGAAGVGKSAIALTVAQECEEDGLVASFFFFRSDPRRNNPTSLILSLAHGIVTTRPRLGRLVNQRITADPRILEATLEDQYKELVLNPRLMKRTWLTRMRDVWRRVFLSSTRTEPLERGIDLVIIDGLDECNDSDTQRRVLSIIFSTYRHSLDSPLHFLICSRPESWIRETFESREFRSLAKHIKLDDSFQPSYDIELYLDHQFREICNDAKYSQVEFPDPWPAPDVVRLLIKKADGQFIYASTMAQFIKTGEFHPIEQLDIILGNISYDSFGSDSPFHDLDELYRIVLSAVRDRARLLLILAAILLIPLDAPASPAFIEWLLGFATGQVTLTLRAMHSVLDVRGRNDVIRPYHSSFTEFLCDRARSKEFFIDKTSQHHFLACRWLGVLLEQSRCNPELSINPAEESIPERDGWHDFCLRKTLPGGRINPFVMVEVDNFYRTLLSPSPLLVSNVLLNILAAVILPLPNHPPRSPLFIEQLLGLHAGELDLELRPLHAVLNVRHEGQDILVRYSTFSDFLCDQSRSGPLFIDKQFQRDFLAQRCVHLLRVCELSLGWPSVYLWDNWADICSSVGKYPTEELLAGLDGLDLGTLIAKTEREIAFKLPSLFRGFKAISSWLKSQPDGIVPTNLVRRFENVQRGFDLRLGTSTGPIEQSPLLDDVVTCMILQLVEWDWRSCDSMTKRLLFRTLIDDGTPSFDWGSAAFCRCSTSTTNPSEVAGKSELIFPISDKTDWYHIHIQAVCVKIVKTLEADLKLTHDREGLTAMIRGVLHSSLLPRCGPNPAVLPLFQKVLEIGRKQGFHLTPNYRLRLRKWLETFPSECSYDIKPLHQLLQKAGQR
ncbi:hypothetical protein E1B28_005179 [Marasmius oreades]|uniref:Nephrocystin 3-like N-terminal domain-containing protein n=1 Tax=Marasmius oreades TaxID=181124 RepID=A0A9P7V087_9AGAR|nr:uncharacterized protein E1B28_005179 [Marasmius oreades]KAG7097867.1 hypothetical protein E1B28_005179 [Marasmius oreades]